MGIKHLFQWFRRNYQASIKSIYKTDGKSVLDQGIQIETLGLDLNGIFHPSAQKVFRYGSCKPSERLLQTRSNDNVSMDELEIRMFRDICKTIDDLVKFVKPSKKLVLCVDGIAGLSKQSQQRARRFKSALENSDMKFDTCSITPGTKLMHKLDLFLDRFIRIKIQSCPYWSSIEVTYSSEKVPGEGEHGIKNYMMKYCKNEVCCIYGLDADLIMLSLALTKTVSTMYVLRENMYNTSEVYCINITKFASMLEHELGTKTASVDFVFMVFFMGNDFLPNIPSLEIITGGIGTLFEFYKELSSIGIIHDNGTIRWDILHTFLTKCANTEVESLETKFRCRSDYFPDKLMEKYCVESLDTIPTKVDIDFENYRKEYYETHFPPNINIETICQEYLYGLQWVMHYYVREIPTWNWSYPYHYAPFLTDLIKYSLFYKHKPYSITKPMDPFLQLLSVIPSKSFKLLPKVLRNLITSPNSPIIEYYPETFEIDIDGKRAEWEGIVKIPMIDQDHLTQVYNTLVGSLTESERCRNVVGRVIQYEYDDDRSFRFQSPFGDINGCYVYTKWL
jgi:5'-3' exonuclease